MKTLRLLMLMLLTLAIALGTLTSCEMLEGYSDKLPEFVTDLLDKIKDEPKVEDPTQDPTKEPEKEPTKEELWREQYTTITIAEALTLCEDYVSAPSTDRYYIIATVKSVDNTSFGQLTIYDETGEIMVYGTNSADGSLKYDKMGIELKAGDVILIYGTLQNYKGNTKEVQNAWLIDYYTPENGAEDAPLDVKSGDTITIEKALAIADKVTLDDYFYISATVKSVTNPNFGEMVLEDETGEILVYNTKDSDGTDYSAMADKPYKGDTVLVKAHINVHNGTKQIKQAYIVEFTHAPINVNPDDYALTTIADARLLEDATVVKVQGVVARITYADGMIPSGFYLIDGTSSIYVYDGDIAGRVTIGNTITVIGEKDHWILATEQNNANKFGYKGCNQITNCALVDNDGGNTAFDTSWITESTIKEIVDTPVSTDISTIVYKVTALVKEVPGNGFTNFYFYDLDGKTSSYAYSQCSGSDFTWLREFDGKICTVYISALNAKSTSGDCFWRFIPVAVIDENFVFDTAKAPEFAVKYHGVDQFLPDYTADPELELATSVSSELLGFENVLLSYSSSNTDVVYFTTVDGKVVMHTKDVGAATITITATLGEYTYSETVTVAVYEAKEYDSLTVEEAIAAAVGETVIVKGIVGPSLVNKVGFYLMGENGVIAVETTKDILNTLTIGNEVIIEATRHINTKGGTSYYGQTCLQNAVVLVNNRGNHEYNDSYFITGKTLADLKALDVTTDQTTSVYVVTATINYVKTNYYTTLNLSSSDGTTFSLYMSGAGQYSWMADYYGQEVTLEIAPCNWNDKTYYVGCVLAIVLEDGTRIYNTSNWS